MKHRKNNAIARLGCAALALPGLVQTASAGRVEETYNADFQYGHYSEGKSRMHVDIFDGALSAPVGKDMTINVGILRDIVSGASPVYNQLSNGRIKQVMSNPSPQSECGESICEQRDQITGGGTYFFDSSALSIGGGLSREHDYTSKFFNTNYSIDLNKKLTTLNFGASVAFDDIQPSPNGWSPSNIRPGLGQDPSRPGNEWHAHKTGYNFLIGFSQVVNKDTLFQSNMTFGYSEGFLTDPYKGVGYQRTTVVFGTTVDSSGYVAEVRPGDRFQWAWLNQYVRHFGSLNDAALHLDYRYSLDNWGSHAHTFEASWHQPIVDGWQIIPRFRYYSQDQVDFYSPVFDGGIATLANGLTGNVSNGKLTDRSYYSSDYRLAGFGALMGGIKLTKDVTSLHAIGIEHAKFQTGFEYYTHQSDLQLGGNSINSFADFHYYMVTASFNLKF